MKVRLRQWLLNPDLLRPSALSPGLYPIPLTPT